MPIHRAHTITRFCAALLVCLLILWQSAAQDAPPAEVTPEATADAPAITTAALTITADAPAQMTYSAQANEAVAIAVRSGGTMDTTLSVFAPDGERVAFNDDRPQEAELLAQGMAVDVAANESLIVYLVFPAAGDYTLVIDSFNGVQEGEVTVSIAQWRSGFFVLVEDTPGRTVVHFTLRPHEPIGIYTFSAQAGETLTISARDLDGGLDPRLMLRDPAGATLAANDDHAGDDPTLDTLDAQIADFACAVDGIYSVLVSDFLGHSGVIELTIQR